MARGLQNALAPVSLLIPVAQFDGLLLSSGGPRRDCGKTDCAVVESHFSFNSRVAPRVKDLVACNRNDLRHL
jgi:hypothetical protein